MQLESIGLPAQKIVEQWAEDYYKDYDSIGDRIQKLPCI